MFCKNILLLYAKDLEIIQILNSLKGFVNHNPNTQRPKIFFIPLRLYPSD